MKVNQTERWLRLAFGMLVLLFAGIIYAWPILKTPFTSEFGWNPAQLSLNYTLTIVFFCLGGFVAGLITNKTTPRSRILISAVLLFGGLFFTSRLGGKNVLTLYLSYGVMAGSGVGFAYTTFIGLTTAWFPDKKGLCSGALLMSFGLTSMIIGSLANRFIKAPSIGWRKTYLMLAIAEGIILIAASFILRAPKEGTIFPQARAMNKDKSTDDNKNLEPTRDYTVVEMIRRSSFWLLFIFITLLASVGSAAIALAADILQELKIESPATLIGILSLFNGFGRLASGALYDNVGIRKTQYIMSAVAIGAPVTVAAAVLTNSLIIGIIGLALCYFSYGFAPTTSSVFASNFYGTKNFSLNFSVLNLILIPAPFAAVMAGSLYSNTGSFIIPFCILAGCSVIGLFLNLGIKKA